MVTTRIHRRELPVVSGALEAARRGAAAGAGAGAGAVMMLS